MINMEKTMNVPIDQEIQLKLKERSTQELIGFQTKLRQPPYNTNPQALAIRFHLIRELLLRHLLSDDAFDRELVAK